MQQLDEIGFMVPECVKGYLREQGYLLPMDAMESYIGEWDAWMSARGQFYDYHDTDGFGRSYAVHRRSIHPAMRVCREWGSLLMNEKVVIGCEDEECTEWLERFFTRTGFYGMAQGTIQRAFGLGTGAWALWVDLAKKSIRVRGYDARMVILLSWDQGDVMECAFVTRVFIKGEPVDQLQMHVIGLDGYVIKTVCFDKAGEIIEPQGVIQEYATHAPWPTFAIIRPAIENTIVDMSPYGVSVFADAIDAIQAVDLAFDALINEVDISQMRIFLSDVMFDVDSSNGKQITIPFGKGDCTVFRKVMSTEDTIEQFAPALRTSSQIDAFRVALQMLGDLCGLGLTYFDFDNTGYIKTATEVSSDNSALMRNIRKHEIYLDKSLQGMCHAVLAAGRSFEETLLGIVPSPERSWFDGGNERACGDVSTLIPDTVTVWGEGEGSTFAILDAKYYTLNMCKAPKGMPGVESVTKQILYQRAYSDFITDHGYQRVVNAFLAPSDGDEFMLVGRVKFPGVFDNVEEPFSDYVDMLSLPAERIWKCYLDGKRLKDDELVSLFRI